MNVGIIGHEAAKFTPATETMARALIRNLLQEKDGTILVSGHCHLGGVDIWSEEEAAKMCIPMLIYPPTTLSWRDGFKPRNEAIAKSSDIVNVIVVAKYPDSFSGRRFALCYHCGTDAHIKSGACWTAKRAKLARWYVI